MVDELAEECDASGVRWVVSVVRAEVGLGDEPDWSNLERIVRIHDPAGPTEFDKSSSELLAGFGKWGQVEHAAEAVGPVNGCSRSIAPATAATLTVAISIVSATTTVIVASDLRQGSGGKNDGGANAGADGSEHPSPRRVGVRRLGRWAAGRLVVVVVVDGHLSIVEGE